MPIQLSARSAVEGFQLIGIDGTFFKASLFNLRRFCLHLSKMISLSAISPAPPPPPPEKETLRLAVVHQKRRKIDFKKPAPRK